MLQVYSSSGSLLSPLAPRAGLAGPPTLRTPRGFRNAGSIVIPGAARRRFPGRRGLGVGNPALAQGISVAGAAAPIGIAAAASSGIIGGALAATAIPIVGPIIGLIAAIASLIGGGCGNACIESAKAEQIYEVAGDDVYAVAKLGMLGRTDYEQALQAIIQGGQQHLQQLVQQGDKHAADGAANIPKSLAGAVNYASNLPANPTVAMDLNQAQAVFIQPNAKGWYPDSVAAGNQLALQFLQQAQSSSSVVSALSGTGSVSVLGTTIPTTGLLLGAALIGAVILMSGR